MLRVPGMVWDYGHGLIIERRRKGETFGVAG
jgi:hypothetical protein